MADLSLTVTRFIEAPPEAVFDAWLDPATLRRFMTPGPGTACPNASSDPQVGGRFALTMTAEGKEIPHGGTYTVIERPRRLAFTWESPFSAEGSLVTLTFPPEKAGPFVKLTHVKFVTAESCDNHERGWAAILDALALQMEVA